MTSCGTDSLMLERYEESGVEMSNSGCRYMLLFVLILVATITTGCATVGDQRVDILYQSSVDAKGGAGDFYLAQDASVSSGGATSVQWIIGGIMNGDGEQTGNIVTGIAPTDLLTDAFAQEFKVAGYNVLRVNSMPGEAAKGLHLKNVIIKVAEKKSFVKDDAKCSIKLSVEPWLHGKPVKKLAYETEYSDVAVSNRAELMSQTVSKALQMIMAQSIPEIIKIIEQQH